MKIDIETLRKTKGIGEKTLERIIKQHEIDNNIKSFKSEYIPSSKYRIKEDINLWQGDCLELMNHIPDKSVDMILADLPYGTTACSWDTIIPFKPLWSHYKRIIKDNGVIVLFGSEPFSTKLRMSNLDWYKYDWIWEKPQGVDPFMSTIRPLNNIENIIIFAPSRTIYNPQLEQGKPYNIVRDKKPRLMETNNTVMRETATVNTGYRYPKRVLKFKQEKGLHPTQKPVELGEYLIKTYTDEGMTVMDNTMGVGTFGVSAKNTNRKFIGIELDENYFEIAKERVKNIERKIIL